jgi:hypothetical protein
MFVPSKEHYDGFRWCTENSIRVYPQRIKDSKNYKIVKQVKNKNQEWKYAKTVFISKDEFNITEASEKVWRFYSHLYSESQK